MTRVVGEDKSPKTRRKKDHEVSSFQHRIRGEGVPVTHLISCQPGGTAARQGGFIGSMAGVVEVGMPKFYLVYFFGKDRASVQGGLGANDVDNSLSKGFQKWSEDLVVLERFTSGRRGSQKATEDISVEDREEVFQVKDKAGPWI